MATAAWVCASTADASFDAGVTLVEFDGLAKASTVAERASTVQSIDAAIGGLALPASATVIVFAASATDDKGEVVVVGVRDSPRGNGSPSSLVSASTRRSPTTCS